MSIVLDRPTATVRTRVDLHLHSTVSDGDDTPGGLARKCADAGLRVAALTDHDSMAGFPEFRTVAEAAGLTVVAGAEVTAEWGGQETHCLAYFVDPDDELFRRRIGGVRGAEVDWWRAWFGQAADLGVDITWAQVEERFGEDRVAFLGDYLDLFLTRAGSDPRFSGYERGGVHRELIAQWCREGQPLHVPHPRRPPLAEVARWIREARGVPVLAHPGRLRDEPETSLPLLRDMGFGGLEAWTTWHDPADTRRVLAACESLGLVPTQGSDFHGGRLKPWSPAPGLVPEAAPDPLEIVERLHDARA
ncbi:PHP domain-containing protein [Streptomyces sp. NBC_01408]|uniref:PHP domain-containing protein n=1 Tax=Streptomyces sp. NBC_01408 TaxID=2903855 RepID=UPI00224C941B|nr:PHP domain-containing protein [Streptomyces sp. NBC_01408]MCX4692891.1 PHP domain-containing protein [Streptomyces sp. NBC_01408]